MQSWLQWHHRKEPVLHHFIFPSGTLVKNSPSSAGDVGDSGSITGLGRYPGSGNGNPLQYSCLENSTDTRAWGVTVRGLQRVGYDSGTQIHQFFTGDGCLKAKPSYQGLVCESLHQEGNTKETGEGMELHISKLCSRKTFERFCAWNLGRASVWKCLSLGGFGGQSVGAQKQQPPEKINDKLTQEKGFYYFPWTFLPQPTAEEPKARRGSRASSEVNCVFWLPAPSCWSRREDHSLICSEIGAFAWRRGVLPYIWGVV